MGILSPQNLYNFLNYDILPFGVVQQQFVNLPRSFFIFSLRRRVSAGDVERMKCETILKWVYATARLTQLDQERKLG